MHLGWKLAFGAALTAVMMENVMAETFDLTVTREIDAPVDIVWRALTEAENIKQWWGPAGFTAPLAKMDLRVGGASLVCMTAPGFPLLCNSWTYTEIVVGQKLSFDQGWVDEFGAAIDIATVGLPADIPAIVPHIVELASLPDGRTELRWSEFDYASSETVAASKAGLYQVLDKLAASLE